MQQFILNAIRDHFFVDNKRPLLKTNRWPFLLQRALFGNLQKNIPASIPGSGGKTIFSSFCGSISSFEKKKIYDFLSEVREKSRDIREHE
jgi:hypothetical protein